MRYKYYGSELGGTGGPVADGTGRQEGLKERTARQLPQDPLMQKDLI